MLWSDFFPTGAFSQAPANPGSRDQGAGQTEKKQRTNRETPENNSEKPRKQIFVLFFSETVGFFSEISGPNFKKTYFLVFPGLLAWGNGGDLKAGGRLDFGVDIWPKSPKCSKLNFQKKHQDYQEMISKRRNWQISKVGQTVAEIVPSDPAGIIF